jgi:hypothetical protein
VRFDPILRALRSDDAQQRDAQQAMIATREAWRADQRCTALFDELARYGAGDDIASCPALASALGRPPVAQAFADAFLDHHLQALRACPLGMAPFRHVSEPNVASLLLARGGRALLMLSAREPGSYPADAAAFSDGERHEIVLAGVASGKAINLLDAKQGCARLEIAEISFEPGAHFTLDQASMSLVVEDVAQRLVVLRLIRTAELPRPSREFALIDGSLRQQASGDLTESRREMMLALLGRMGRRDAAPAMEEIAREGSVHLRWQALRECLALDSAIGFRALIRVARDPADPLAAQAGALHAGLAEAHPELTQLEPA